LLPPSTQVQRYKLSFGVGGLNVTGASIAARLYLDLRDWAAVRAALDSGNLLQARTVSTAKRFNRELIQRISQLRISEVELLTEATADERADLMWAAVCRRYTLVAEFAEEVLRDRYLLMASDVLPEHFEAFVRGKTVWHPELAELKASTFSELRNNLFRLMREAGLVTVEGMIVPAMLSSRVRDEFALREPSDIRFFPTNEAT
jgi:hypothetical protein